MAEKNSTPRKSPSDKVEGIKFIGPDGKTMTTEEFRKQVKTIKVSKVARSIGHLRGVIHNAIEEAMKDAVPIECIVGAIEMEKDRYLADMNELQRRVQEELFQKGKRFELKLKGDKFVEEPEQPPEQSRKEPDYIG